MNSNQLSASQIGIAPKTSSDNPTGTNFSQSAEIGRALVARLQLTGSAELDAEVMQLTKAAYIAASLEDIALNPTTPVACKLRAIVEIINRTEGLPRAQLQIDDRRKQLAARSKEELEYFLFHGRWPEDEESAHGADVDQKKKPS